MKRLTLLGLLTLLLALPGCGYAQQTWSHFKSSMFTLPRTVTLYSATGEVLKKWQVSSKVEDGGGSCRFLLPDGRAVIISGTYVVEQSR